MVDLRSRREPDFAALTRVAERVKRNDDYPAFMRDDDFDDLLRSVEPIDAWVAEVDGEIVGQIALHGTSSAEVTAAAVEALGVEPMQLVFVARLLVDPAHRRVGAATALLDHAFARAQALGRTPVLDVVDRFKPAIRLYEQQGWVRLATCTTTLDGQDFTEHVYHRPR